MTRHVLALDWERTRRLRGDAEQPGHPHRRPGPRHGRRRCPRRRDERSRDEIADGLRELRRPHDGAAARHGGLDARARRSRARTSDARPGPLARARRRRRRSRSCRSTTVVARRPEPRGHHRREGIFLAARARDPRGRAARRAVDRRRRAAAAAPPRPADPGRHDRPRCPSSSSSRPSCAAHPPRTPSPRRRPSRRRVPAAPTWSSTPRSRRVVDAAPARPRIRRVTQQGMPKVVLSNGVTLHYQQVGEGPDLVMVHGITGNLAVWHLHIVPVLCDRFRVAHLRPARARLQRHAADGLLPPTTWRTTCSGCSTRSSSSGPSSSATATAPTSRSTSPRSHPERVREVVAIEAALPAMEHVRAPRGLGRLGPTGSPCSSRPGIEVPAGAPLRPALPDPGDARPAEEVGPADGACPATRSRSCACSSETTLPEDYRADRDADARAHRRRSRRP